MGVASSHHLLELFAVDLGVQCAGWMISSLFKTEKHFDLFGSLTYIGLIYKSYYAIDTPHIRQSMTSGMVLTWALRLGSFLFHRVINAGEDKRFKNVRSNPLKFLLWWVVQAVWVYFTIFPALLNNAESKQPEISNKDYVGAAMWVLGFLIEVVADHQKTRFRSISANNDKFINTGLWSISRHPNYFGEVMLWSGVAVLSSTSFNGWKWIGALSPCFVYYLLNYVSGIPILEKTGLKRYGHLPAYQSYIKSVPSFMPFFGSTK